MAPLAAAADLARLRAAVLDEGFLPGQGHSVTGKPMGWTLDVRLPLLRSQALDTAARAMWALIQPLDPDAVGGMALSADPLVVATLMAAAPTTPRLRGFLIRQEAKAHGLRKQWEGWLPAPGSRLVLVDDILNSGATIRRAIDLLAAHDVVVAGVVVVVDLEGAGAGALRASAIPCRSLFTATELGLKPAVEFRSAEPLWSRAAAAEASTAGAASDIVVVTPGHVVRLSATGEIVWRTAVPAALDLAVDRASAAVTTLSGELWVLARDSGRLRWRIRLPQAGQVSLGGESVVCSAAGSVMVFDQSSGEQRWTVSAPGISTPPVLLDGAQSLAWGETRGAVVIVDVDTGRSGSSVQLQGEIAGLVGDPAESRLFATSRNGWLSCVDAGQLLWSRQIGRSSRRGPLLVDEVVVAAGPTHLLGYDRCDGRMLWTAALPSPGAVGLLAGPGGNVLCYDSEGRLLVVDSGTGAPVSGLGSSVPCTRPVAVSGPAAVLVDAAGTLSAYEIRPRRGAPTGSRSSTGSW